MVYRDRIPEYFLILFLMGITSLCFGQEISQSVSGKITDQVNLQPISDATVTLDNGRTRSFSVTDEQGYFSIRDLAVGRYRVTVSHLGYRLVLLDEISVDAGKEFVLNLSLEPAPIVLSGVEFSAGEGITGTSLSSYRFNNELSERIPATFYDPARIVTGYPGIAAQNDEANNVSIRGNTPVNVKWRIQGLDFVNPNHLTNAGTYSDRPGVSGGGVSVLSAQLLSRSKVLTGAFPPQYGNAISGIFDISLRPGNANQNEYTLQAGLLGLEGAVEGPFSGSGKDSYLVNYRYSTIGILSALGVDLGEESIDFQDLSFNLDFDMNRSGKLNIFGLGGLSTEKFTASRDSADWHYVEDREDTRFDSDMGGIGAVYQLSLSKNSSLTSRVSYSKINSTRNSSFIDNNSQSRFLGHDGYDTGIMSINPEYKTRLGGYFLTIGSYADLQQFNLSSRVAYRTVDSVRTVMTGKGGYWIHQPYIDLQSFPGRKFSYTIGMNYMFHSLTNQSFPSPRVSVTWIPGRDQLLRFQYGLPAATQIPQAYYVYGSPADASPNRNLGFTKSHQVVMSYDRTLSEITGLTLEAYYQYHYDVPVGVSPESTYSIVNAQDAFIREIMVNGGNARNIGIECTLDHRFGNGIYYLADVTWYDSKYRTLDGVWRNSRFNGQYGLGITGGKEFEKTVNIGKRIIGINGRIVYHGGFWHTPIDEAASRLVGEAVFIDMEAFTRKLPDYYRLDVGCYFKRHKKNYTRTLLIAIQNVTNHRNIAYQYFDLEKNDLDYHYQLGIIPSVSYRVEF